MSLHISKQKEAVFQLVYVVRYEITLKIQRASFQISRRHVITINLLVIELIRTILFVEFRVEVR